MGIIALTRLKIFPLSKSAPRAFCAFLMRSVSSMRMGINRSAMLMTSASACTGTLIHLSGVRRLSTPSVSETGVVVYVSSEEQTTRSASRSARNAEKISPSFVIVITHHSA